MRILVIGRGLLGGSMCRQSNDAVGVSTAIRWADPAAACASLAQEVNAFAAASTDPWGVAWCAGAGVVGTAPEMLDTERRYLSEILVAMDEAADGPAGSPGAFFMASSAGGVYGSGSPEYYTERSPVSPRSAYGEHKLEQESIVTAWAERTGTPTLIGRISNLYGGDQDLAKRQGFVSQICRSILTRTNFVLSVPADTQRDFLYADDAAVRILSWCSAPGTANRAIVKILSAGRPRTLVDAIHVVGAVSGIRPRVVMAANAASALQPRYLRFRSVVRPDLDAAHPARGLEIGSQFVWRQMLREYAGGGLR